MSTSNPVYKVLSYDEAQRAHQVEDDEGNKRLVDLLVNGDFDEDVDPEALIGKTYRAAYDYPFIAIAVEVSEVKE